MTQKICLMIAGLAMILSTHSAFAGEVWMCAYVGTWDTSGSANKGDFNWKVRWEWLGDAWSVVGDYTDRYGASYLDGSCSKTHCELTQTYTSGDLNGSVYIWSGDFTDKIESATKTTNTFTGTWKAKEGSNNGKWAATATCTKE